MTDLDIEDSPWFKWLERRFGAEVATRIIRETGEHALAQKAIDDEEKHRDSTGL